MSMTSWDIIKDCSLRRIILLVLSTIFMTFSTPSNGIHHGIVINGSLHKLKERSTRRGTFSVETIVYYMNHSLHMKQHTA